MAIGGAAADSTETAFSNKYYYNDLYITGTTQNSGGTLNNLIVRIGSSTNLVYGKIGSATNPF